MVAQRPENTKIADLIIVMKHGRITEEGTYDELAAGWRTSADLPALSHDRCHPPAARAPATRARATRGAGSPLRTDGGFRAPGPDADLPDRQQE
ncbi:hypothetical protein [Streptomyces europaeiscabiei]|uniref:hypothetical protein n=1 Tax=Streptomyces europaeiscabiei TaxID=146819 RepID=UPI002E2BCE8C|nr:hypothetical protein [Streptomyces europaeiscabiei]